jgi:toxin-antitoxin system PIN domain toxin
VIVLDVNVLVAAYFSGHQRHQEARRFLRDALAAGGVAVPDVVWSGFARIVTNPVVVRPAATWEDVTEFAQAVRRHAGYRHAVRGMTAPVDSFLTLCQSAGATGNVVSDAYIAATAADAGASVATWDSDFERFPAPVVRPS